MKPRPSRLQWVGATRCSTPTVTAKSRSRGTMRLARALTRFSMQPIPQPFRRRPLRVLRRRQLLQHLRLAQRRQQVQAVVPHAADVQALAADKLLARKAPAVAVAAVEVVDAAEHNSPQVRLC